jgi:hypothetical protein
MVCQAADTAPDADGDQMADNTAAPTWLLPSAVGVVLPVDGDSRACRS